MQEKGANEREKERRKIVIKRFKWMIDIWREKRRPSFEPMHRFAFYCWLAEWEAELSRIHFSHNSTILELPSGRRGRQTPLLTKSLLDKIPVMNCSIAPYSIAFFPQQQLVCNGILIWFQWFVRLDSCTASL